MEIKINKNIMKYCNKCSTVKLNIEFNPYNRNSDGLFSQCKECVKERNKKYYSIRKKTQTILHDDNKLINYLKGNNEEAIDEEQPIESPKDKCDHCGINFNDKGGLIRAVRYYSDKSAYCFDCDDKMYYEKLEYIN